MNSQAAPEWNITIQRHRTVILNYLLLTAIIIGVVALVSIYITLPEGTSTSERWFALGPFVAGWLVVLVAWAWRGLGYRLRALVFLLLTYILGITVFARGGLPGSGRAWLLLFPAVTFILAGPRLGIAAGAVSVLTYAFFTLAISQKWVVPQVAEDLTTLAPLVGEGGSFLLVIAILTLTWWSFYNSWLDALARASTANEQLQAQAQELQETNEQLHRRTSQLQTTAEIARAGSSILDPDRLLTEVVNRVQDGFSPMGVYYVGLFLLDETQRSAVLKAATGEAGKLSLDMDYSLELDEKSTVGWCITRRRARIGQNVGDSAVQFDSLAMPHTRSEIALPLRSRGNVLGALSVHSSQEAAFDETNVAVLQAMADQVAVAIDNAQLFSQTTAALKEVQAVQRHYLTQAWKEFLTTRQPDRIDYTQPGAEPGNGNTLVEARREALEHGRTISVNDVESPTLQESSESEQAALVVPLKLREQTIGTIVLSDTRHRRLWTNEDVTLAETIAEQLALTVDNLRLFGETQRRAARERLVGEISDRIQQATDMEDLMRITAEELNKALGGSRTFVQMSTAAEMTSEKQRITKG